MLKNRNVALSYLVVRASRTTNEKRSTPEAVTRAAMRTGLTVLPPPPSPEMQQQKNMSTSLEY